MEFTQNILHYLCKKQDADSLMTITVPKGLRIIDVVDLYLNDSHPSSSRDSLVAFLLNNGDNLNLDLSQGIDNVLY